jgi:hypothetical protein
VAFGVALGVTEVLGVGVADTDGLGDTDGDTCICEGWT